MDMKDMIEYSKSFHDNLNKKIDIIKELCEVNQAIPAFVFLVSPMGSIYRTKNENEENILTKFIPVYLTNENMARFIKIKIEETMARTKFNNK